MKIFITAVLSEISDFDPFLNIVISDLLVNCNCQNGFLKCSFVDLKDLWKFESESKNCQKVKIFMTTVLSKISDFDHFLIIAISDLWVNCNCQNGFLKCYLVDLKDLWKFEVESKFCQKLKILMTAVLSEISDFDHYLSIVISDLLVNCNCQKWYSKVFFWLFLIISVSMRFSQTFVKNLKFPWSRSLAKFQILTTFLTLSFLTCEWIAIVKMVF